MTEQGEFADAVARIEQAAAEIKIAGAELADLPKQLTDIVAQAGFQATTAPSPSPGSTPPVTTQSSTTIRTAGSAPLGRYGRSNSPRQLCLAERGSGSHQMEIHSAPIWSSC